MRRARSPGRSALMSVPVWLALLATACSGESETKVDRDVTADTDAVFDGVDFETEISSEVTLPSDFGDECDENADCDTEYCVQGAIGFVCTRTCVSECPDGWGCKGVQSGSADVVFVCVQDGTPEQDVIVDTSDVNDSTDTTVVDTGPGDTNVNDTGDTTTTDTGNDTDTGPTTGNACEAAPGAGNENIKNENTVPSGDWPDCIVGCGFEANPTIWVVDKRSQSFTAAGGLFDFDEHLYTFDDGEATGPDIDVVAVKAPARTMLEFAVLKAAQASFTQPLLYVSDGFQVRTFNDDINQNNACARTTIAFPYISDLPVYVVAEETVNYDLWTPTGYLDGTVGGGDYGWLLRIRTSAFAPTELGNIARGSSKQLADQALELGGDTRYFRFYAPGTANPTVTITRKSGAAFAPSVAGMKTIEGELVWQRVVEDPGSGVVEIGPGGFRACVPQDECPSGFPCPPSLCTEAQTEFVFAVYDYNGAAGPGRFAFDIAVRVD